MRLARMQHILMSNECIRVVYLLCYLLQKVIKKHFISIEFLGFSLNDTFFYFSRAKYILSI